MCGRYALRLPAEVLADLFGLMAPMPFQPRFNIAPSQSVAAVRMAEGSGERDLVALRWGLIPSWAKDAKIGYRLINARSETAADKPSFRSAFRHRRCLIPADGFYEWQRAAKGKQPFFIRMRNDRPFAFAGLWERWQDDGKHIESCTILTTGPNELMTSIHNRMPVILPADRYDQWLDTACQDRDKLQELLIPYAAGDLEAFPLSTLVNSPKNDLPGCIEPLNSSERTEEACPSQSDESRLPMA